MELDHVPKAWLPGVSSTPLDISYVLKRSTFWKKHYSVCEVLTFNYQFEDRTCITFHCDEVNKQ